MILAGSSLSNVLPIKLRSYVQFSIFFTNFYLQLVPEARSSWIKPRVKVDNSTLPFAEFKNKWSFSSTICLYGLCRLKNFAFSVMKIFTAGCVSHPRQVSSLYVFIEVCFESSIPTLYVAASLSNRLPTFRKNTVPPSFSF